MIIRDASGADADAVFSMAVSLAFEGGVERAAFDRQFGAALALDRTELLVADDGGVIGYLLGVITPMFVHNDGFGFVQELYVDAERRRGGVASALMAEFTARAAASGASVTALATSRAGAFYEAIGYTAGATYYKRRVTR